MTSLTFAAMHALLLALFSCITCLKAHAEYRVLGRNDPEFRSAVPLTATSSSLSILTATNTAGLGASSVSSLLFNQTRTISNGPGGNQLLVVTKSIVYPSSLVTTKVIRETIDNYCTITRSRTVLSGICRTIALATLILPRTFTSLPYMNKSGSWTHEQVLPTTTVITSMSSTSNTSSTAARTSSSTARTTGSTGSSRAASAILSSSSNSRSSGSSSSSRPASSTSSSRITGTTRSGAFLATTATSTSASIEPSEADPQGESSSDGEFWDFRGVIACEDSMPHGHDSEEQHSDEEHEYSKPHERHHSSREHIHEEWHHEGQHSDGERDLIHVVHHFDNDHYHVYEGSHHEEQNSDDEHGHRYEERSCDNDESHSMRSSQQENCHFEGQDHPSTPSPAHQLSASIPSQSSSLGNNSPTQSPMPSDSPEQPQMASPPQSGSAVQEAIPAASEPKSTTTAMPHHKNEAGMTLTLSALLPALLLFFMLA